MGKYINTMLSRVLDFDCYDKEKKNKLAFISYSNYENIKSTQKDYFRMHSHEYTEITLLVHGNLSLLFNGTRYAVTDGNMVVIDPRFAHNDHFVGEHECFFLGIYNCSVRTLQNNLITDVSADLPTYRFLLYKIMEEITRKRKGYKTIARSLFQAFISQLSRDCVLHLTQKKQKQDIVPQSVAIVKDYILKHYSSNPSLSDLAALVALTPHQVNILFKKYYNDTPHQFLIKAKLQASAYDLLTRDNPIKQIAENVGFNTAQNYITAFTRIVGMSPQTFRDTYSKDIKKGYELIQFTAFPSEKIALKPYGDNEEK